MDTFKRAIQLKRAKDIDDIISGLVLRKDENTIADYLYVAAQQNAEFVIPYFYQANGLLLPGDWQYAASVTTSEAVQSMIQSQLPFVKKPKRTIFIMEFINEKYAATSAQGVQEYIKMLLGMGMTWRDKIKTILMPVNFTLMQHYTLLMLSRNAKKKPEPCTEQDFSADEVFYNLSTENISELHGDSFDAKGRVYYGTFIRLVNPKEKTFAKKIFAIDWFYPPREKVYKEIEKMELKELQPPLGPSKLTKKHYRMKHVETLKSFSAFEVTEMDASTVVSALCQSIDGTLNDAENTAIIEHMGMYASDATIQWSKHVPAIRAAICAAGYATPDALTLQKYEQLCDDISKSKN